MAHRVMSETGAAHYLKVFFDDHDDHEGSHVESGEWSLVMVCPKESCPTGGVFETVEVDNSYRRDAASTLARDRAVTF